jgi:uncharacterized membrane protein YfcA
MAGPALVAVSDRNGAAAIMCAMCLAGLVGGRIVGVPGRVLLPVALGLFVALWMIWVDPPASSRKTSALAHTSGGIVAGWALVEALDRRISDWLAVAFLALLGVFSLTVLWELGEYVGDRLLDTTLVPRTRDSAEDVLFGIFGGMLGITFSAAVGMLRRSD